MTGSQLEHMLAFNQQFVKNKDYEMFVTDKYPDKRIVILTCMDTRLVELLPRALDLKNGDAKIIKNAGALVMHPFGSAMRSILVAIYELNAEEVYVIGHKDCGMTGLNCESVLTKALTYGVHPKVITTLTDAGINLNRWLTGFSEPKDGVTQSVETIYKHPLLPPKITIHGLIIDPHTGELEIVLQKKK